MFIGLALILVLVAGGLVYILYSYESSSGGPKAAVVLGESTDDCSQVSFHVENQDTRILRGWSVVPVVSPTDPHIRSSPSNYSIEALGPRGNSSQYVFDITLTGAPTGIYRLQLDLVNGSSTIAVSPSISCSV